MKYLNVKNIDWAEKSKTIDQWKEEYFGGPYCDFTEKGLDHFYEVALEVEKSLPSSGKCNDVGNELFRAIQRVCYRMVNDGDLPYVHCERVVGIQETNPSLAFVTCYLEVNLGERGDYDLYCSNGDYKYVCDCIDTLSENLYVSESKAFESAKKAYAFMGFLLTLLPELHEVENYIDSRDFDDIEKWDIYDYEWFYLQWNLVSELKGEDDDLAIDMGGDNTPTLIKYLNGNDRIIITGDDRQWNHHYIPNFQVVVGMHEEDFRLVESDAKKVSDFLENQVEVHLEEIGQHEFDDNSDVKFVGEDTVTLDNGRYLCTIKLV